MDSHHPLTTETLRRMLVRDVHWLLEERHDHTIYWKDTNTALVEMIHLAWYYGDFTEQNHQKTKQKVLLERACKILHHHVPKDLTAYLGACNYRKRNSSRNILRRYQRLAKGDPTVMPILFLITRNLHESADMKHREPTPSALPATAIIPRTLVFASEQFTINQRRVLFGLCIASYQAFYRQIHKPGRKGRPFIDGDPEVRNGTVRLTIDVGLLSKTGRTDIIARCLPDLMTRSLKVYQGKGQSLEDVIHPIRHVMRLGQRGRKFTFVLPIVAANLLFSLRYGYVMACPKNFLQLETRSSQRMYLMAEDWKYQPFVDVGTSLICRYIPERQYHYFGRFMRRVVVPMVHELQENYDNGGDIYIYVQRKRGDSYDGSYPRHLHIIVRHRLQDTPQDNQYYKQLVEYVIIYFHLNAEDADKVRAFVTRENFNTWIDGVMNGHR
ncbi:MAG: hypothetical protein PUD15_07865 [Prevotella sp.]|nr:hypothetical protein [Prevotella sp.]